MYRISFLLIFLICAGCTQSRNSRPNIIFIMSDDHAVQAISSYNRTLIRTPNIDRLADEGMRFDNCFCTNSICAPSRAAILTGKYSHANGVLDNRQEFDTSQPTLPKLLQAGGYTTAMVGKWHLKSDPVGFDYWNIFPGQGAYYNPDMIEMGDRHQIEGYATDIITDKALEWLENRDRSKPFLLMYQHKAPHRNWMPALRHLRLYNDRDLPVPENYFDDYATRSDAAREQEMEIAHNTFPAFDLKFPPDPTDSTDFGYWKPTYERFTPEQRSVWDSAYAIENRKLEGLQKGSQAMAIYKYQRYIKDYLRCIAAVDENIGRVLDYLDDHNLADNTIVIYTSDQGFFLGEHGWFDKRFMYEEALRMPLLIRFPAAVKAGTVNEQLVLNIDFAPTLLDLAGVRIPDAMQGVSFRPLLEGKQTANWRSEVYYHYYEYPGWHMVKKHYGVRTERYKLIHFYDDIDAWELYDLKKDPSEMTNVYQDQSYSGLADSLHGLLDMLIRDTGDTTVPAYSTERSLPE